MQPQEARGLGKRGLVTNKIRQLKGEAFMTHYTQTYPGRRLIALWTMAPPP